MTATATITRAASHATPSRFSLRAFEGILLNLELTISLNQEVKHMPHHDPVAVGLAQEMSADAWIATEEAAFAFLRSHSGTTAVPLFVETIHNLVNLLDIETEEHPYLSETMESAIARHAKAPCGTEVRALLDRAIPLLFGIASMQAEHFGQDCAHTAA